MSDYPAKPDYKNPACWAVAQNTKTRFDVFYLYPTFYQGHAGTLMDVYTANRRLPYIKKNVLKNCGIFSSLGNIYAPLYRQASFASLKLDEAQKKEVLKISMQDIKAAFNYYLKNFNNGKPFVLAGHSQGSRLLRELIKEDFQDTSLGKKLIAAYLIGAEVTKEDTLNYPWLKLAASADDTGIIITYNTQGANVKHTPIFERGNAVCTNPLNWSAKPAAKSLNKGAVFFDKDGNEAEVIKHFTSAYIDGACGALITPDVNGDKYSLKLFPKGVYHIYDYEFFYRNLQSNFRKRLKNYETKLGL